MPRLLRNNQASRPDVAYDVSHNLCGPSSTSVRTKGFSRYFGQRLKTPLMTIGRKRSWTQGKEECGHLQTHRDEKQWPVLGQFNPALPSHSLDNPPSVLPRFIKMKMMTSTFSVQFHPTYNWWNRIDRRLKIHTNSERTNTGKKIQDNCLKNVPKAVLYRRDWQAFPMNAKKWAFKALWDI